MRPVKVIGGGLAGSEAAWQIARRGFTVELHEMRPERFSPAHRTADLAELVCSNSLKSRRIDRAGGLLKEEIHLAGSIILESALQASIPGGSSLCVDRSRFAHAVTGTIQGSENIRVIREEVMEIPGNGPVVIATGPLTSNSLSVSLSFLLGRESLFFYDAISPTVDADTIAWDEVFIQDRYSETGAYVNCPLDEHQYRALVNALRSEDPIKPSEFEESAHFEACLPVEELAARGENTLAFGPLRPVGLTDPRTGRRPYAVVQLRPENRAGTLYSMVGFQTRLRFPDQEKILRTIPGLGNARFERLGTIHRNTYVDAPVALDRLQRVRNRTDIFLSGQIAGVEGYMESAASGLMTGLYVSHFLAGSEPEPPPETTMTGAILAKLSAANPAPLQPVNAQFGLLPPLDDPLPKKDDRRMAMAERALRDMSLYLQVMGTIDSGLQSPESEESDPES
jgi:methylenetetrahydrofolate--tRNA-(uracil-5-)-methyltransferase